MREGGAREGGQERALLCGECGILRNSAPGEDGLLVKICYEGRRRSRRGGGGGNGGRLSGLLRLKLASGVPRK